MPSTGPSSRSKAPQPSARLIRSDADVALGLKALRRQCPVIRRMHDLVGHPPLRLRQPGFEGLARIVVGQQVSVASANAIWERTRAAIDPFEASTVLALSEDALRAAGLSRPKVRTLQAIAGAIAEDGLDLAALADLDAVLVHERLCAISGIGPWTADVFALFCMGHADAFAPGDLALQAAAQTAFELAARPDAKALAALAERWRPWRGVAARLLWAYYKTTKASTSGVPV
ncbi:MAG: DNA-3-methyladenine glycosylase family protein [Hyphomicrobiaceae bacterium]